MLEHAEKAGEAHALAERPMSGSARRELAFLLAVDLIALNATSKETAGVTTDLLLDILVLTARKFRDRELARARR